MQQKLNKDRKIVTEIDPISGLIYKYKYGQNKRIVNIYLKNKSSKNKTIIKEDFNGKEYAPSEKKDFSEKYIITIIYDKLGREKKLIRYNRTTRKRYVKENLMFKENEAVLWIEDYSGKRDFGFKLKDLVKHNF